MKRINQYKKLFSVENTIDLKELKKTYRTLVKEWHPDKFLDEAKKEEAGKESQKIIEGYHFLVSIAPETRDANIEDYTKTITESKILDFKHKGLLFEVTFTDGHSYEYFGVNSKLYNKFRNSDKQLRFARRNIFTSYTYRKSMKEAEA